MSINEIEVLAAKGEALPKDLKPPEIMLYYMLAGLYARYQTGKLARPEAVSHKQSILSIYERLKNEYEQYISICKEYQERLRSGYYIGGKMIIKAEEVNP